MPSTAKQSLLGRRVVVTRAPHQAGALSTALQAVGAEVVELPVIEIAKTEDWSLTDQAIKAMGDYDMLLVGSTNAIQFFAERVVKAQSVVELPIGCVGNKSAKVLRESHRDVLCGPLVVPSVFRAEALLEAISAHFGGASGIKGKRFLFPRAVSGRTTLIDGLEALGAEVNALSVYRIVPALKPTEVVLRRMDESDAVVFLSGETLRCFLEIVPNAKARLAATTVAMIGPVAQSQAAELGVRVDVVAPEATIEALVRALGQSLVTPI